MIDLRNIIRRIAWKRILVISATLYIGYTIMTTNFSCHLPRLRLPTITIPSFPNVPNSPIHDVVVLAMILITIMAVVKILRQRR